MKIIFPHSINVLRVLGVIIIEYPAFYNSGSGFNNKFDIISNPAKVMGLGNYMIGYKDD